MKGPMLTFTESTGNQGEGFTQINVDSWLRPLLVEDYLEDHPSW